MDRALIEYGRTGQVRVNVLALQAEDIVAFLLAILECDGRAILTNDGDDIVIVSGTDKGNS
jgi:hypothetical protein